MKRIAIVLLIILISATVAFVIPNYAVDFHDFYSAGRAILAGQSPYSIARYYNPAWVALLFTPFALIPEDIAYRLYAMILLAVYLYILWVFSNRKISIAVIASFSPFVLMTLQYGNIDWFILVGAILPAPIGIWLVLAKPQMGIVLAALWVWKAYSTNGIKRTLVIFGPVGLGLLVSLLWGMRLPNTTVLSAWSADVWPIGLIVGVPLIILSFLKKDKYIALASGPFISPYLSPPSWAAILPIAMRNWKTTTLAVGLSWIMIFIWRSKI